MDADPVATLRDFNVSLDTIEAALVPLLARPLTETREALGSIERAKLDVLLAYTVNNLVWMYLRMRGIEPDNHGVAKELRVKGYYDKVRDAEDGTKPKTRNRIDKDAAKRFITHSIGAPASSNAAMARRQAEAAIRERQEGESRATRANRFRHVAAEGERLSDGEEEEDEEEEEEEEEEKEEEDEEKDEEEGMEVDEEHEEPIGDSEDEAAALLAEVDDEVDSMVPEPAEARVDAPSRRSKRKRAEDLMCA
ncbi:uncharacterized protein CcaverHIS019_0300420 [Cutaneotrichosporon cavernicola]|uniref:Exosome complex protein n=1 Tax=Cutaneotrichosporon cavernicola TaxID=279322 RepID=A0AA48IBX6_9TREE|nr:uncharacterized protein CcaverHIS019_0300420 [Cutaneotrichosporon cavernicola]BEI89972.1 hypothetical protein CcaverHIS019_0300420 [Cutaneotrichosporon cavernicola]